VLLELWPLVARVGVELQQEGIQPKQRCHHQNPAIAVLDTGRGSRQSTCNAPTNRGRRERIPKD
jgi:hypothetical protein